MTLRVKTIRARQKAQLLTNPRPTFVSIVDYAATQTPFAVLKSATPINPGDGSMKNRSQKKSAKRSLGMKPLPKTGGKVKKTSTEELHEIEVFAISFAKSAYKTKAQVESWLKKNQWTDYKIEENEETGEWKVTSKSAKANAEDGFDLKEVPLDNDGIISALVGVKGEKLGKAAMVSKAGEDEGGEKSGDEDEAPADENGDEDGDTSDDDDGSEDDDDDDDGSSGDDDADEDEDDDASEDDDDAEDDDDDDDGEDLGPEYDKDDTTAADDEAGDPEGYRRKKPSRGGESIEEKEADEPHAADLPGQSISQTGRGKPGFEPGNPGKYRLNKRKAEGRNPLPAVDKFIRKFDYYGLYLSGGKSLSEVISDGSVDGIPPGVSEVFSSLMKAVGNVLKDGENVEKDIGAIGGEFTEAVVALHGLWAKLAKKGTKEQKAAAKKYFEEVKDLQTFATNSTKSNASGLAEIVEKAVAKAVSPLEETIDKQNALIAKLKKGTPVKRGADNDDVERELSEEARIKQEEDEDAKFILQRNQKSIFGTR